MTEQEALLRNIIENPADDLLRLVYADWLDDNAGTKECPCCRGSGRLDADHRPGTIECRVCEPWGSGRVDNGFAERAGFIRRQMRTGESVGFVCGHDSLGWFPHTHEFGDRCKVAITRGFISRITGPLDAFWRESDCNRCRGNYAQVRFRGPGTTNPYHWECEHCTSGIVSGLRPALVNLMQSQPVEAVHISDRGFGVEIDPPGQWYRWQAYAVLDVQQNDYVTMNGWETRDEMIDALGDFILGTVIGLGGPTLTMDIATRSISLVTKGCEAAASESSSEPKGFRPPVT